MESGAASAKIKEFLKLGTNGKHESHLERDLHRLVRKYFGIPDLIYPAKVIVRQKGSSAIGREKLLHFLLPHEFFGMLAEKHPDQYRETFGLDSQREFWANMFEAKSEWLDQHPLRINIEESSGHAVGYRLFGDDTGLNKGADRPATIVTWTAEGCDLPVWFSRLPILVLPVHWCLADVTIQDCHAIITWSLNCLAMGRYPHVDHTGAPFPANSHRGKLAGKPLTPEGDFAVVTASMADWKWNADHYHFPQKYSTDELCQRCCATKHSGPHDFARFDRDCPRRAHGDYIKSEAAKRAPLTKVCGWHLSIVHPEVMHGGPLGHLQSMNGSLLKDLADSGVWGEGGPGAWDLTLGTVLSRAFDDFAAWSKVNKKEHNQPRFTVAKLSLKSKKSFPYLKGKAHNSLVITEWLATLVSVHNSGSHYHNLRECVAWSWNTFFTMLRSAKTFLSDSEMATVAKCEPLMFKGFAALEKIAFEQRKPLFKMLPKIHLMFEALIDIYDSRKNPCSQWAFGDEDSMMKLARIAAKCHGASVDRRTLERWLLQYLCELVF